MSQYTDSKKQGGADGNQANLKIAAHYQKPLPKGPLTEGWGVRYSQAIKHINGCLCPHCDSGVLNGIDYRYTNIVGYDPNGPLGNLGSRVLIFECPQCYKHYWAHTVAILLEKAAKVCPKWPQKK